jgi:hypothetical protein
MACFRGCWRNAAHRSSATIGLLKKIAEAQGHEDAPQLDVKFLVATPHTFSDDGMFLGRSASASIAANTSFMFHDNVNYQIHALRWYTFDTKSQPQAASTVRFDQYKESRMTKVTYEIVEHDGGWAYRVDGVFSEPFPSHDLARKAAERAAREQIVPGETTAISYEDKDGRWHDEMSAGKDRPETDVAD